MGRRTLFSHVAQTYCLKLYPNLSKHTKAVLDSWTFWSVISVPTFIVLVQIRMTFRPTPLSHCVLVSGLLDPLTFPLPFFKENLLALTIIFWRYFLFQMMSLVRFIFHHMVLQNGKPFMFLSHDSNFMFSSDKFLAYDWMQLGCNVISRSTHSSPLQGKCASIRSISKCLKVRYDIPFWCFCAAT